MNHCFTAEMTGMPADWGVMGVHYFRPDLLGVTATAPKVDGNGENLDFDNPSVLIYEPEADGSLELVAIENLVFEASWKAAGNDAPPTLLGRTWEPWPTTRTRPPTRPTGSRHTMTSTSESPRQPKGSARTLQHQRDLRPPPALTAAAPPSPGGGASTRRLAARMPVGL